MFGWLLVSAFLAIITLISEGSCSQEDKTDAISDGETILLNHPHHLSLEFKGKHICGASLIQPTVALTAASCTYGKATYDLTVRGGVSYKECAAGSVAEVLSKCDHHKYDDGSKDYDVSVLFLGKDMLMMPVIQDIPLQPENSHIAVGVMGEISGWGFEDAAGHLVDHLGAINVTKISDSACGDAGYGLPITERMSCYVINGRGLCANNGEFGGALVIRGKQAGIASRGLNGLCGGTKYPTVYTEISDPQISGHIKECMSTFTP